MTNQIARFNIAVVSMYITIMLIIDFLAKCKDGSARLQDETKKHHISRFEVCHNGQWGTVCGKTGFDDHNAAAAACKHAGFKGRRKIS